MKPLITTAILSAALIGAAGCAEDASVRNDSDRYYSPVPPPASPAAQGSANDQDLTLRAEPASAQIGPTDEQPTLNPNMPSGNTIQPGGTPQGVPGTTSRNPGTVPPTAPSGGNTTGAAGR